MYSESNEALLVPSDYAYRAINKGTTHDRINAGYMQVDNITQINITELYNWYAGNIESKVNALALTRNSMLFQFLVDYILINITIGEYLYFEEGTPLTEIDSGPNECLEAYSHFIDINNLPGLDIMKKISLEDMNIFQQKLTDLIKVYKAGEKAIIPVGYNKIISEFYSKMYTEEDLKRKYPYGLDLFLKVAILDIASVNYILGDLDNAVERCLYKY